MCVYNEKRERERKGKRKDENKLKKNTKKQCQ
jgi:hypothetical protein